MRRLRVLLALGVLVALASVPASAAFASEGPLQSGNLLENPGFEGEFRAHDDIGNIKVARGWTPWYVEGTEAEQADGYGRVAEFFPATREFFPNEIHEGNSGQGMKHDFGQGAGGIYQQVTVPNNANLRFTVWGIGYSCQPKEGQECGSNSTNPSYLGMQIAIDPTGGTDFYADQVVFTPGTSAYDEYKQFEVDATAQGTRVTVFIMYYPDYPVLRNRVIWDDASLTVGGSGGSSSSSSSSSTSGTSTSGSSSSTSGSTTTTTTTTAATYTVKGGDSLGRIATANNTTVSALVNLNGPTYASLYSNPNLIYPGWVLKLTSGSSGTTTTTTTGSTSSPGGTYTVQDGDYLARIASAQGVTVTQIINLNSATYPGLSSNPNLIYTGWVLKLP